MSFSNHFNSHVLLGETLEARERIKNSTTQTINIFQTIFVKYSVMLSLSLFSDFSTVNKSIAVKFTYSIRDHDMFSLTCLKFFSILVSFASGLSKGFRL